MVDVFVEAMRGPLKAIGFVKRTGGNLFTSDLGNDMVGWIGLNTASEHYPKGVRGVHPNVGIRHQFVARWEAELRGAKLRTSSPPTIMEPLYTLMPGEGYVDWEFDENGDTAAVAQDIADAIADYGLPWMHANANLDLMIKHYEFYNEHPDYRYLLPIMYAMKGRIDESIAVLDEHNRTHQPRNMEKYRIWLRFVEAFKYRAHEIHQEYVARPGR